MATDQLRVGIDDIVEATSAGVLRALEARKIDSPTFTSQNGFFVKLQVWAGGYPGPVENPFIGSEGPGGQ